MNGALSVNELVRVRGKRETGESPVRVRHCELNVWVSEIQPLMYVIGKAAYPRMNQSVRKPAVYFELGTCSPDYEH